MCPIGLKTNKKILEPKLCFDLWIETGSTYKTCRVLRDRYGVINPATGKMVTAMGVWDAAWRYILENMVEGRKGVSDVWRANGEILEDRDWYPLVIRVAKYLYYQKKVAKWMEKHSYLTPYLEN